MLTAIITATIGMIYHAPTTQSSNDHFRWTNNRVFARFEIPFDPKANPAITHPDFVYPGQNYEIDPVNDFAVTMRDGSVYQQSFMNPRMDKIQWDDAFWYVCDGVVIRETSDKDALDRMERNECVSQN